MHDSTNLDILYQCAVDVKAKVLLNCSTDDIISVPDYGNFVACIAGKEQEGNFWHYRFSDGSHHVHFQLHRQLSFGFYRKYLAGIKMNTDGLVSLLTDEEVADYD